ncbi:class I adenylate-forming enzyme family protein [Nonomuraea fastidiosa]|uniref:class I adenylate-forming enzyme family protein n=1 Tax=Nonomuraea fastidiosa TaxID=46173 RepID=UPI00366F5638
MPVDPYPRPVLDLLAAAGDRPVFEHGDRAVTGARLLGMVRRCAAGLRAAGVGPGDGLALLLGISPEAFAAIIAGYVVGARVVGVRPGLPDAQLRHLLSQDITAAVTDGEPGPGDLRLDDLLSAPDDGGPLVLSGRHDDVARIVHTSGSTGTPKACAQTYAAMNAAWTARPESWPPAIRELASRLQRYLVFGTLSSQVMMEYGILTLAAGGTLVAAEAPSLPEAIVKHRASAGVITVPRLYKLVAAQRATPADLSSLRALMVSGSPVQAARLREAREVLGPVVFHGYGQTETGTISMATPDDPPPSLGVPPDVIDISIRDASGAPVPPGQDGELYVRTPSQAVGYWGDPEETARVFVDGWVRTRDLGHFDADGRLHLIGRTRDVIIVNAELHYAGPIERALAASPDLAEAYVIGAPDEDTGEAVHAFVVPAPGRIPDFDALRHLVRERLGAACVPATITVIDEVPAGPNGKPDKRLLKAPG